MKISYSGQNDYFPKTKIPYLHNLTKYVFKQYIVLEADDWIFNIDFIMEKSGKKLVTTA